MLAAQEPAPELFAQLRSVLTSGEAVTGPRPSLDLVDHAVVRLPRSDKVCAPPGTRTPNPLIKSQLLCQLS